MSKFSIILITFFAAIALLIIFFSPKDCHHGAGVIFDDTVIRTCDCLGLILSPGNPFGYEAECYGVVLSRYCTNGFVKIDCN